MKNRSKKFKIISAVVVVYLVLVVALLFRDRILKIGEQQPIQQNNQAQDAVQTPVSYDYDAAYQKVTEGLSYDPEKAPMRILKSDCANLIEESKIPALERMEQGDSDKLMADLQVFKRMEVLNIDSKSFETPEFNWKNLYNEVSIDMAQKNSYQNNVTFSGNSISQLNTFIQNNENAYITITSDNVTFDETLRMKSNIGIDAKGVTFVAGTTMIPQAVLIEKCTNVALDNMILAQGNYNYGLYIIGSSDFSVENCQFSKAEQKGLVIMDKNTGFVLKNNTISENGNGGILFNGNISRGILENNTSKDNYGTRNLAAGLSLSAIIIDDVYAPYNYETFKDEHLYDMTDAPHDLVLYRNTIENNNSSGLYSDGSYCTYIVENVIANNDKEGMCLDFGTFGDYVGNNIVRENGGRLRQSDEALAADFITSFGRLEDGSSPSKLPGISIDNSAYNIIVNNDVGRNYGSGIKMVRSGYRNIIMENSVSHNNVGQSENFHFFGIELGHAKTPDEPVKGLDFTADYENIVARNVVTGSNYSGIYLGEDSYCNDIFDNVIMNSQWYAIECHSNKFNSMLNNTMDQKVLNLINEQK